MNPVTKEEWLAWKEEKVTREFIQRIHENRESLKEGWAEGLASNLEQMYTTLGQCQGIKDVIDYALRDFHYIDLSNEGVKQDD